MNDEEIMNWLVERMKDSIRGGRTLDQIYKDYCKMFSPDLVKDALLALPDVKARGLSFICEDGHIIKVSYRMQEEN